MDREGFFFGINNQTEYLGKAYRLGKEGNLSL